MKPSPEPGSAIPGVASSPQQDGAQPGRRLGIASLGCGLGALSAWPLYFVALLVFPAGWTATNGQGRVISEPGLASRIGGTVEHALVLAGLVWPLVAAVLGFIACLLFRGRGRQRTGWDFRVTGMVMGVIELVL